jgi:hypothetical protein
MIHGNSQIISFKTVVKPLFARIVVWAHTTSLTLPNVLSITCTKPGK